MCRNCGAIVGAGESQCAVCGAAVASQRATQSSGPIVDRETMRFARALLDRPYKFTIILLVVNFFLFILMWQSSGMKLSMLGVFPPHVLIPYGAKLNLLINEHQWWRFVTPNFLHINLLHLLVNMYSLWIVGPYVEKIYGSAKFTVFWVLTGIAAYVASYLTVVKPGTSLGSFARFLFRLDGPSAGASGALFGLVGVLFVFGIRFRHELPDGFKRAFGTGLLPMILINLFIGYIGRGLFDNAAHLGGLLAGAAVALIVDYRRPGESTGVAIVWQVLRIVAISIVVLSFAKVVQHFNDPLPNFALTQVNLTSAPFNNFVAYAKALNQGQETFFAAMKGDTSAVDRAVQDLESAPHLDDQSDKLKESLRELVLEARNLRKTENSQAVRENLPQKEKQLAKRFAEWSNEYEEWLKTAGKTHAGLNDGPVR